MDDFGNFCDKFDNWEQWIGTTLDPYGYFEGNYWPITEGM